MRLERRTEQRVVRAIFLIGALVFAGFFVNELRLRHWDTAPWPALMTAGLVSAIVVDVRQEREMSSADWPAGTWTE
ncbi:hypothetical protein [Luteipulveratus mongoliensis]|uniref:Uncharacterized protein n=1 Tax=Luteipulveratus mongoliensis TaxID=571913 RepID=A0A0K1JKP8_9MICO|nr:hypothetical protein [Luteipulveratus mongoliensis]AKU17294.1 hypothetical protein VV02_17945 [Luteipulveratus mongoliensis]